MRNFVWKRDVVLELAFETSAAKFASHLFNRLRREESFHTKPRVGSKSKPPNNKNENEGPGGAQSGTKESSNKMNNRVERGDKKNHAEEKSSVFFCSSRQSFLRRGKNKALVNAPSWRIPRILGRDN